MSAYYNELDAKAAAWLRELIKEKLIAPGEVDERSIVEVQPDDLRGFRQVHFFAGIGGWSYALRLAGWPDDEPVWTGSCPCQPFSAAGKRKGTADHRHLWPEFARLIAECSPPVVFGEQVASKDGRTWLAGVRADLEALGYAVGAADLCAAGVGAPHIRQRLWWVADAGSERRQQERGSASCDEGADGWRSNGRHVTPSYGATGGLADANKAGQQQQRRARLPEDQHASHGHNADRRSEASGLGHAHEPGSQGWGERLVECSYQWPAGTANLAVLCADGQARRFEPGAFPLVDGAPARVGRLRGYGNAIVPQVAAEFILAFKETACE